MSDSLTFVDMALRMNRVRVALRHASRCDGIPPACAERIAEALDATLAVPTTPSYGRTLVAMSRIAELLRTGSPSDIASAAEIADSFALHQDSAATL